MPRKRPQLVPLLQDERTHPVKAHLDLVVLAVSAEGCRWKSIIDRRVAGQRLRWPVAWLCGSSPGIFFYECTPANNCEQLLKLLSALRASTFPLC
jgi:hypothetical protein